MVIPEVRRLGETRHHRPVAPNGGYAYDPAYVGNGWPDLPVASGPLDATSDSSLTVSPGEIYPVHNLIKGSDPAAADLGCSRPLSRQGVGGSERSEPRRVQRLEAPVGDPVALADPRLDPQHEAPLDEAGAHPAIDAPEPVVPVVA